MIDRTRHGLERAQKRGIPKLIVNWLIDYGRSTRRRGANVYFFDKFSRRQLQKDIGRLAYKRLEDMLNAYVVVSDCGKVITAGWRYKRIRT